MYYLPCLFSKAGKAVVCVLYATFLAIGIYGLTQLQARRPPSPCDHQPGPSHRHSRPHLNCFEAHISQASKSSFLPPLLRFLTCASLSPARLAVLPALPACLPQLGLEPQLAAPANFYLVDYYNTEFGLGEAGPPAYIVLKVREEGRTGGSGE